MGEENKKGKVKMSLNSMVAIGCSLATVISMLCGVAYASGQQQEFVKNADEKVESYKVQSLSSDEEIKQSLKDFTKTMVAEIKDKQDIDREQTKLLNQHSTNIAVFINTMDTIKKEIKEINNKMSLHKGHIQ